MRHHDELLVIGGDHNASVGKLEQQSSTTKAIGKCGRSPSNEAGNDLIAWFEFNGRSWANSFLSHHDRRTWFHEVCGRWYELDGFLVKQEQRQRIVKKIRTVEENSFLDRRPVTIPYFFFSFILRFLLCVITFLFLPKIMEKRLERQGISRYLVNIT